MKEFREGQKAWSVEFGEVEIGTVSKKGCYPVTFLASTGIESFTSDGKFREKSEHPTLFHSLKDCQDYFNSLKEKRTYSRWFLLYGDDCIVGPYITKKDAVLDSASGLIECREITWEA